MKFKKFSEIKFELLCYVFIPIFGGAAGALRGSEWIRIGQFISDNRQWFLGAVVWLFMIGIIRLFAEAPTPKLLKVKRLVGYAVITLWIWG